MWVKMDIFILWICKLFRRISGSFSLQGHGGAPLIDTLSTYSLSQGERERTQEEMLLFACKETTTATLQIRGPSRAIWPRMVELRVIFHPMRPVWWITFSFCRDTEKPTWRSEMSVFVWRSGVCPAHMHSCISMMVSAVFLFLPQ